MKKLLREIKSCDVCAAHLELGPNPVVTASPRSRIIIIGQAPGTRVHKTGIPWNDPSGDLLREWLKMDREMFYDPEHIALIPMGFCYPGKGKSGDLPPRPECAPLWHEKLFAKMKAVELILLIGQYSQKEYLAAGKQKNLTETVRNYKDYLPRFFPLPHPSPRNRLWLRKNPWFDATVIPALRRRVKKIFKEPV